MTHPTDPDALCPYCQHPRDSHVHFKTFYCVEVVAHNEEGEEVYCHCDKLGGPQDDTPTSPSPAHDTPAAQLREALRRAEKRELEALAQVDELTALAKTQGDNLNRHAKSISDLNAENHALRERLAEAERELAEWEAGNRSVIPTGIQRRDQRIAELEAERDLARAEVNKLENKITYMQADIEYLSDDRAKHRAEAADLRAQLATWMDNYNAAKLAEGEAWRWADKIMGYLLVDAETIHALRHIDDMFENCMIALCMTRRKLVAMYQDAKQPAPRPDTEAE